jgi:hypothetical protein
VGSLWVAHDGGALWLAREGGPMPAVADVIAMSVGDSRLLTMDFGNLKELRDADADIAAAGGVGVAPSPGVAATGQTNTAYTVSAWFAATAAGSYTVAVTVTLTDGTVLTRQGALVVQ